MQMLAASERGSTVRLNFTKKWDVTSLRHLDRAAASLGADSSVCRSVAVLITIISIVVNKDVSQRVVQIPITQRWAIGAGGEHRTSRCLA